MHRWDVVFVRADEKDVTGHPAVLLSSDDILADAKQHRINAVVGTKKQPGESARAHHVILDDADGLEHLTLVDCSLIYMLRKASILRPAGSVTVHRRQEVQRKIRACLGLG
jgi:mRNA-degrading endonuclease toxin of MazEF toxin-antitoxin module